MIVDTDTRPTATRDETPHIPTEPLTDRALIVSELAGPTIAGEGASAGRLVSVIRCGGCNLACDTCETPHTWDSRRFDLSTTRRRMPVRDIVDTVISHDTRTVIIGGGEPLVHQTRRGWHQLLNALTHHGKRVEIETNGTIIPTRTTTARTARFHVTPRLAHSGEADCRRIIGEAIAVLRDTGRADFLFSCRDVADVDEASAVVIAHELPRDRVWIVPQGRTAAGMIQTAQAVVDRVLAHRFNLGARPHILLWGSHAR